MARRWECTAGLRTHCNSMTALRTGPRGPSPILAVPGAMEAGLSSVLFWGALAGRLAVAFVATLPVNRALMSRGKGHAVVHTLH